MKKYIVLIGLFVTSLMQAQQTEINPELVALVNKAIAYYPKFRELEASSQMAATRVEMVRGQYLPVVTANGSFRYQTPIAEAKFQTPGGEQVIQFQPHDNYDFNVGASGPIFDFGRTKAQIQKAIAEAELSKNSVETAIHAVAYQIAQLYYGILFTQKSLTVQQGQIDAQQANINLINAKLKNGDALELDLLNAQVALANIQNRRTDLEAQLEKQKALVTMLTGEEAPVFTGQMIELMPENGGADLSSNRDLAFANGKIDIAEKEITVYRKSLLPSLNYNGGLGFRNGYQPDIHEMRFNWAAGVGVSYPLYVGGRDKKQILISKFNLDAAKAAAASTLETIRSEMAQSQADAKANRTKLTNTRSTISQAQTALKLARTRFENGVATNVDVLTAQTNLEQAQLAELQAQYQLSLSVLNMKKLQGEKFW